MADQMHRQSANRDAGSSRRPRGRSSERRGRDADSALDHLRARGGWQLSHPASFIRGATIPNRRALEEAMATLEGGSDAAAFGSGLARGRAASFSRFSPGDHVVAATQTYHGTAKLLRDVFVPWGLAVDFVGHDAISRPSQSAVRANTKLRLGGDAIESAAEGDRHRAGGARSRMSRRALRLRQHLRSDLQRPFELGADLVVYSATKYLGGHSDVTGGIVVTRAAERAVSSDCGSCKEAPARCPRRSIAGSCCAVCARCRGGCARNPRTRSKSRRSWRAIRSRTRPLSRLADASGSRAGRAPDERVQRDALVSR